MTYLDENEDTTLFIDLNEFDLKTNNQVYVKLSWFDNKNKSKDYNFNFVINSKNEKNNFTMFLAVLLFIILAYLITKKVRKNEN